MTFAAFLRHLAFAAGLAILSACVVRLMIAVRVMDTPEARKSHDHPTPKGGGAGILVAFLVGIWLTYVFAEYARLPEPYFIGVLEGTVAIALVAFLDDLFDWPFVVKLGAQILAAVVVVQSGLYVSDYRVPYVGPLLVGWLGPPATMVWLLFATNAMNFIDGLNGLAAGVSLIACIFLAVIAATHGGWFAYFASLLLAAGITGFLPFNFPKARIFMGDVGSQFCGFMLAVLGVVASRFDGIELSLLLVPMLLSGVLFDVAFTLVRRALGGARLTEPHRGHLYQVAQRAGAPASWVALDPLGIRRCRGGLQPGLHCGAHRMEALRAVPDLAATGGLGAFRCLSGQSRRHPALGVTEASGRPHRPFPLPPRRSHRPPSRGREPSAAPIAHLIGRWQHSDRMFLRPGRLRSLSHECNRLLD